jgi:hypothetical protein
LYFIILFFKSKRKPSNRLSCLLESEAENENSSNRSSRRCAQNNKATSSGSTSQLAFGESVDDSRHGRGGCRGRGRGRGRFTNLNDEPNELLSESNQSLNINKDDLTDFFSRLTSKIVTQVATQFSQQVATSQSARSNNNSEIIINDNQSNLAEEHEVATRAEQASNCASSLNNGPNLTTIECEDSYSIQMMFDFAKEKKFPKISFNKFRRYVAKVNRGSSFF